MTVSALAGGAAWWAVGLAAAADAAMIAGTTMSITAQQQQANAAEASARAQAAAQQQLYEAQAEQYAQQAAENARLAAVEEERAGIAQLQGEQEAEARSRALAAEIGSLYAGFAGNGLLVGGDAEDTFANVLKSSVIEGQADISTIRDNTAINVWNHKENERAYLANAAILQTASSNALVSAGNAFKVGESQANAAQAGVKLNAVGQGLSTAGSMAGMGVSSYSTLSKTGTMSTAGMYDWDGASFAYNKA